MVYVRLGGSTIAKQYVGDIVYSVIDSYLAQLTSAIDVSLAIIMYICSVVVDAVADGNIVGVR